MDTDIANVIITTTIVGGLLIGTVLVLAAIRYQYDNDKEGQYDTKNIW